MADAMGFRPATIVTAVAWVDSGIIVRRIAAKVSGDVTQTVCAGTGLFIVTRSGNIQKLADDGKLCDPIAQAPHISMTADARLLLYADRWEKGRIYSVDVQKHSTRTQISSEC
ncbi:MAG: hypothetical protein ACREMA_03005, partial [Longimicrobiales bacterium]